MNMTDTEQAASKDVLMEALADRLLSPQSNTPANPGEWTEEQRTTFVQALQAELTAWGQALLQEHVAPPSSLSESDVENIIDRHVDEDFISSQYDADEYVTVDVTDEVQSELCNLDMSDYIDEHQVAEIIGGDLENQIKRLVFNGCSVMNDAGNHLIKRATNGDGYGGVALAWEEDSYRILSTEEYNTLMGNTAEPVEAEPERDWDRIERLLNFVEETFVMQEPEPEPEPPTNEEVVASLVAAGMSTTDILQTATEATVERARALRTLRKPALLEAAEAAGLGDLSDYTIPEILGRLGA
jgi:hypothetical protein